MMAQRFSIDTNILIYSIDKDAGTRHEDAQELVDALADEDCVLTLQALAEFFHAVTRKDKNARMVPRPQVAELSFFSEETENRL